MIGLHVKTLLGKTSLFLLLFGFCLARSATAALLPPVITVPPLSQTVQYNDSVTFSVVVVTDSTLTYQWLKNGVNISGATLSTYTIAHAQFSDQGTYSVQVVNSIGSATSSGATLTVHTPPSITSQPQSKLVAAGQNASFAVAVTGTSPFIYHWRFNGVQLAAGTGSALSLTNVQPADAGGYTVVVANSYGAITSAVATLTLGFIPSISTQPKDQWVVTNNNASFWVVASGTATLGYQWRLAGTPLAGATKSTLSVNNVQTANAGSYTVVVTNSLGSVTSAVANLILGAPAYVITDPQRLTVTQGQAAFFSVTAGGTAPCYYQWRSSGAIIPGATNSTLVLTNVQPTDAGTYKVTVSNPWGSDTSVPASLTVNTPPSITTQPQSQAVAAGQGASLSVVASGVPSVSYQWNFNGTPLPGATGSSLALGPVQTNNAGNYFVVVTNSIGSVTSAVAALTVISPTPVTPPTLASPGMTSTGFTFQLSVPAGSTCVILASTNFQDWTPISTNFSDTGTIVFTDTDAPNYSARFYRALLQ